VKRILEDRFMEVWATWEFWASLVLIPVFFFLPMDWNVILIGILSCWAITSTAAGRISAARAAERTKKIEVDADIEIKHEEG